MGPQDDSCRLWTYTSSTDRLSSQQFVSSALADYFISAPLSSKPSTQTSSVNPAPTGGPSVPPMSAAEPPSYQRLSADWLQLWESGNKTDIEIICKGEKTVRCHSLVLQVGGLVGRLVRWLVGYLDSTLVGW